MEVFTPYKNNKSILIIRSNAVSDFRIEIAAKALRSAGYFVDVISEVPFYKASQYDLFICCRPGASMVQFLNVVLDAGKKLIVDLDDDFNSIPKHNPSFMYMGPGNQIFLRELKKLLLRPGIVVTYASPELANRYKVDGIVVPNMWDDENALWDKGKPERSSINIGFSGTMTHREDFKLCEGALKKILEENENVNFVTNLDLDIHERFNHLPERRRLFLPGVFYWDYPLIFQHIDILVVPLRDTYFNRAKSDVKLMECGATRTPWVASALPVYEAWAVGGTIVPNDKEWESSIMKYIADSQLRKQAGDQGREKAETRRGSLVAQKYVAIVDEMLKEV